MMDTFKIIQQIFHTRCISLYGLSQVITTYLVTSRSVLIFASTTICPLAPTSVDVHVIHEFFHNTTNTKPIVTTRITTSSSTFINLLTLIEFSFVTSPRFQTLTITLTVLYKVLSLASFVDSMIEQFFRVSVALIVGELYQWWKSDTNTNTYDRMCPRQRVSSTRLAADRLAEQYLCSSVSIS